MEFQAANRDQDLSERSAVLAVGASVRQAAGGLGALGFKPIAADLYGDRDTRLICEGRVYRLGSLADAAHLRDCVEADSLPVLFAGGLEGALEVANEISAWGGAGCFADRHQLEALTDPAVLNGILEHIGINRFPFVRVTDVAASGLAGKCVAKDISRSGTAKVFERAADVGSQFDARPPSGVVVQRWIDGDSVSVVFASDGRKAQWVGGSRQWVASESCNCNRLTWCGSIGGLELEDSQRALATAFADQLVALTGIKGLLGIDFIVDADGIWPVDVNPRIPASLDVVGERLIGLHLKSFGVQVPDCEQIDCFEEGVRGKAILFNPYSKSIVFPESITGEFPLEHETSWRESSIADVPPWRAAIPANAPVLTTYAAGETAALVEQQLESQLKLLNRIFVQAESC